MKKTLRIAVVSALFPVAAQAANLLVNGSFEDGAYTGNPGGASWTAVMPGGTDITGWVSTWGADWHQDQAVGGEFGPAFDGIRMVDLTLGTQLGGISQTFATVPGVMYHLSYAVAAPFGDSYYDVSIGDSSSFSFVAGTNPGAMEWDVRGMDFVASGTTTTLTFTGLSFAPWGAVIDDASVSQVPDGGTTLALLGLGLSGLGWVRRRMR